MGTCSYVLTGTEQGMTETFGTTCHGAVRVPSRPRLIRWSMFSFTRLSLDVSSRDFLSDSCLGSGSRSLPGEVPQEPGLPGRPGQARRQGHRHPSGVPQTGHGGGEKSSEDKTRIVSLLMF